MNTANSQSSIVNCQSPRCASCAYYTRVTISAGLCEPPTDRGGEPFAVQCRPHFIACHLFKAKPTPKKNEHTPA